MPDGGRKGLASSPSVNNSAANKKAEMAGKASAGGGEETSIKVASKKEGKAKANGNIKLRKQLPKHSNPGAFIADAVIDDADKKQKKGGSGNGSASARALSPGPVVNQLDDEAHDTFAFGWPLEDSMILQQCKHCRKSILSTAAREHISACLKLKKEKAQRKKEAREARERAKELATMGSTRKGDDDGAAGSVAGGGGSDDDSDDDKPMGSKAGGKAGGKVGGAGGKKTEAGVLGSAGKKRKAEAEPEGGKGGPKAKKKKDEPKAKAVKAKGPVDVERQCGVITPSGQPCARSLTCKTHSMGAKRGVPGRSLPYDMLLAAYQKKNQAKQQKAALDANAPLPEDDDPNAGPVDSDEETAAVMSALARWNPQPVVPQPVFVPIKRQYQLARLHEQLQTASNGGRVNIFKVPSRLGPQQLPDGGSYQHNNQQFMPMQAIPRSSLPPDPGSDDALGEPDPGVAMLMPNPPRRSASFTPIPPPVRPGLAGPAHAQPPQRRPSVTAGRA